MRFLFGSFSAIYTASLIILVCSLKLLLDLDYNWSGFAYFSGTGPFYCKNLMSSGRDDDAMIIAFICFLLPLIYRIFRFTQGPSRIEQALFAACLFIALLGLYVAQLDCANILYTAFGIPDPLFATLLTSTAAATLAMIGLTGIKHTTK